MTPTPHEIAAFERAFERVISIFDEKTIMAIKAAISAEKMRGLNPDKPKRTLL